MGGTWLPVYLVGFNPGQGDGPWRIDSDSGQPRGSEVVLDRGFAHLAGVHLGDQLTIFGRRLRVAGTSAETDAAGDFFLFVPLDVAQSIAGAGAVSYGLVRLEPGVSVANIASQTDKLPGVHAVPRERLTSNDGTMITTSFGQPIQVLALVGLIAGVLIAGIVLCTATVEHSRNYAVLKAVGAGAGTVYGNALLQSVILSVLGALLGWGLAWPLARAFDALDPVIESHLGLGLQAAAGAAAGKSGGRHRRPNLPAPHNFADSFGRGRRRTRRPTGRWATRSPYPAITTRPPKGL